MSHITIITAFYNIKREDWGVESRTDEKYFEQFKYWARIKNNLVVYVENEQHKRRVKEIREEFDLGEKTTIITTGPMKSIDEDLYMRMKAIAGNPILIDFHMANKNPEAWNVDYNYITGIKGWFVKDAVDRGLVQEVAAWLDFGFGHGNYTYKDSKEFSFEWKYDFPDNVSVYCMKELKDKPVFDIVRTGEVFFGGFMVVAAKHYWNEYWELMRNCIVALLEVGLMDDDQTILYMAYRLRPEFFHVEKTGWFTTLKEHGGEHLTLVDSKNRISKKSSSFIKEFVHKVERKRNCKKYLKRQYKYLMDSE